MKAERYLRVDKREFLMEVLVVRLVKLLRITCIFLYLGNVQTEHSPSRAFAVLKRDLKLHSRGRDTYSCNKLKLKTGKLTHISRALCARQCGCLMLESAPGHNGNVPTRILEPSSKGAG